MFEKISNFLNKGVWLIHTARIPKVKAFWVRCLRIIILTVQGFTVGSISSWASALTYYSLLSFVPLIAIMLGISRGFHLEKNVQEWLLHKFSQQKEIVQRVIEFAEKSLEQTRQGLIAGLGVLLLLWAVIKILRNIEESFNSIWRVREMRPISRQFTDYLAMILFAPFFILLTSGFTIFLSSKLSSLESRYSFFESVGPIFGWFIQVLPFVLSWFIFATVYIFMPNTKVKFLPALISGVVTGSIYQVVQWAYIIFQVGVAEYNTVYGTFAALPLFLIWLQLSWIITLLGCKIAYAIQNVDAMENMPESMELSQRLHNLFCLRITQRCVKQTAHDLPALTNHQLAHELSIPEALVNQLLKKLVDSNILNEVRSEKNKEEHFYLPAMNIDHMSIQKILQQLRNYGVDEPPVTHEKEVKLLLHSLQEFDRLVENSKANVLLKDL